MVRIFQETRAEVVTEAEVTYRQFKGLEPDVPFNSKLRKNFARFLDRFAESRMWDKVGEKVANSNSKVGEVVLEVGSDFSKSPGKFAVVSDPSKVKVKDGMGKIIESLEMAGKGAEPEVALAAKEWARMKNVGKVKGVFRFTGRVLIVVGVGMDLYRIYRAEDKLKATTSAVGGWAGAFAFSGAFATFFAPADVAGPVAWIIHGVGTLVAGGIGYCVGSETTEYLYELVVEE